MEENQDLDIKPRECYELCHLFLLTENDLNYTLISEVLETYLFIKRNIRDNNSWFLIEEKLEYLYLILPSDELYNVTALIDYLYEEYSGLSEDALFLIFKKIIWYLKEIRISEFKYYIHYNDDQLIDLSPDQISVYEEKERVRYTEFYQINQKYDELLKPSYYGKVLQECRNKIIECLSDNRTLKTREQIERAISNKNILHEIITPDIALDYKGLYFYTNYLRFDESEISILQSKIKESLEQYGMAHIDEIYEALRAIMPDQLDDNYIYTSYALFSVLSYLFKKEFIFDRPYVLDKKSKIKTKDNIIYAFLNKRVKTEISQLGSFMSEKKVFVPSFLNMIDSLNDIVCFENRTTLIKWDSFIFESDFIKKIEKLIYEEIYSQSFKPIVDLECTFWFPDIDLDWDEWFIYSVLKKYSKILYVKPSNSHFKYATPVVSIHPNFDTYGLSHVYEFVKGHRIKKNLSTNLDDIEIENVDELLKEI